MSLTTMLREDKQSLHVRSLGAPRERTLEQAFAHHRAILSPQSEITVGFVNLGIQVAPVLESACVSRTSGTLAHDASDRQIPTQRAFLRALGNLKARLPDFDQPGLCHVVELTTLLF